MSNAIYYFSGTGNSLYIAKKLSKEIPDSELINIFNSENKNINNYDNVGFIFPVHFMNYPDAVIKFIKESDFSKVKYIYAVCTSGGTDGNLFHNFNKYLLKKGKSLNYGFHIKLADNSLMIETKQEIIKYRFDEAEKTIKIIVKDIVHKEKNRSFKYNLISSAMSFALKIIVFSYYRINNKNIDQKKCIKCSNCINTCPSKNIIIKNDLLFFKNQCYNCFACINICPKSAISFGKVIPGKFKQYKNPYIM